MLVVSTVAVTPGVGYACVVGAGSAGGAATLNGSDGADSTFGALVTASGGQGGGGGPRAPISLKSAKTKRSSVEFAVVAAPARRVVTIRDHM